MSQTTLAQRVKTLFCGTIGRKQRELVRRGIVFGGCLLNPEECEDIDLLFPFSESKFVQERTLSESQVLRLECKDIEEEYDIEDYCYVNKQDLSLLAFTCFRRPQRMMALAKRVQREETVTITSEDDLKAYDKWSRKMDAIISYRNYPRLYFGMAKVEVSKCSSLPIEEGKTEEIRTIRFDCTILREPTCPEDYLTIDTMCFFTIEGMMVRGREIYDSDVLLKSRIPEVTVDDILRDYQHKILRTIPQIEEIFDLNTRLDAEESRADPRKTFVGKFLNRLIKHYKKGFDVVDFPPSVYHHITPELERRYNELMEDTINCHKEDELIVKLVKDTLNKAISQHLPNDVTNLVEEYSKRWHYTFTEEDNTWTAKIRSLKLQKKIADNELERMLGYIPA